MARKPVFGPKMPPGMHPNSRANLGKPGSGRPRRHIPHSRALIGPHIKNVGNTNPWQANEASRVALRLRTLYRVEDYIFLMAEDVSHEEAVKRIGVGQSTGYKYRAMARKCDYDPQKLWKRYGEGLPDWG